MLEAVLEQAGLDASVLSSTTCKASGNGEDAILSFSNATAAARCIRHFHGRRWSSKPVTALLVEDSVADVDAIISNFTPPPGLDLPAPPGLDVDEVGNQGDLKISTATATEVETFLGSVDLTDEIEGQTMWPLLSHSTKAKGRQHRRHGSKVMY